MSGLSIPGLCPIYLPGKEPMPPGTTDQDRENLAQIQYYSKLTSSFMESCPAKCALSGVAGFGLGGLFSLVSASFAVDDPMRRSNLQAAAMANAATTGAGVGKGVTTAIPEPTTMQQTGVFFRETGKNMYRSAKGFGRVGALYAGIECCIEAFRAKNDIVNPVTAGFLAGGILARNSGPQAILAGGAAFAAFSAAIDLYMHKQPAEEP